MMNRMRIVVQCPSMWPSIASVHTRDDRLHKLLSMVRLRVLAVELVVVVVVDDDDDGCKQAENHCHWLTCPIGMAMTVSKMNWKQKLPHHHHDDPRHHHYRHYASKYLNDGVEVDGDDGDGGPHWKHASVPLSNRRVTTTTCKLNRSVNELPASKHWPWSQWYPNGTCYNLVPQWTNDESNDEAMCRAMIRHVQQRWVLRREREGRDHWTSVCMKHLVLFFNGMTEEQSAQLEAIGKN